MYIKLNYVLLYCHTIYNYTLRSICIIIQIMILLKRYYLPNHSSPCELT